MVMNRRQLLCYRSVFMVDMKYKNNKKDKKWVKLYQM